MEYWLLGFGIFLVIIGILSILKWNLYVKYRVWSSKLFTGGNYIPTEATYKLYHLAGIVNGVVLFIVALFCFYLFFINLK